jgi:hypothetical protein
MLATACGSTASDSPSDVAADIPTDVPAAAVNDEIDSTDMDMVEDAVHDHDGALLEVEYSPVPTISLEVLKDNISGWNVHATPTDFILAPEHVSTDPLDGEGHMHLYIDGVKITRMYSEWYHIADMDEGDHEIRVELSANNHSALGHDGVALDTTVTITQELDELVDMATDDLMDSDEMDSTDMVMEENADHDHSEVTDGTETLTGDTSLQTYHLVVADGEVQTPGRIEIDLGSVVQLHIHSDVSDQIHVHGYDILRPIEPGGEVQINFVANLPGVWETEMEDSGLLLIELVVS